MPIDLRLVCFAVGLNGAEWPAAPGMGRRHPPGSAVAARRALKAALAAAGHVALNMTDAGVSRGRPGAVTSLQPPPMIGETRRAGPASSFAGPPARCGHIAAR